MQHQQFYELVQNSQKPLIVFGKNFNGDTIASSLALASFLHKIDKPTTIASPNFKLPTNYKFIDKAETIKDQLENLKNIIITLHLPDNEHPDIDYKTEIDKLHIHVTPKTNKLTQDHIQIQDTSYQYDLIIILNSPDLESLDYIYHDNPDFFYQVPVINIDHATDNEHYGHLNLVNVTASSISEIIYDLLDQIDPNLLDEYLATYLLTGMIEKTKSFKIPTVSPKSLNIASRLMAFGAERDKIIENLYRRQTISALRLWGRILLSLKTDHQQKIAWATIKESDFQETKAISDDLIGVIEELIVSIPTIELSVIFFEKENNKHCLIKSEKNINLTSLFAENKPKGNSNFVTFKMDLPEQDILEKLQTLI